MDAGHSRSQLRREGGECPVCAVHVQPEVVLFAEVGDGLERIVGAGRRRASARRDAYHLASPGARAPERIGEALRAKLEARVDGNRLDATLAETGDLERALDRVVSLIGGQER